MELRQFELEDLEDTFAVLGHPEVMRYSLSGPYSRSETEEFIRWCRAQYRKKGQGLLAVTCPPERKVIGYCGFYFQDIDAVEEVEIGYRLHPDYWGRGIATEAAGLLRDYGFETLKLPRLISIIAPENIASVRVAEKIGMTYWRPYLFRGKVEVGIYGIWNPLSMPG